MAGCGLESRMTAEEKRDAAADYIFGGFHRLEHGLEGVVGLDSHDGEGHVLGGDGLAVMEHGVGDEMEREALLVFGKGP